MDSKAGQNRGLFDAINGGHLHWSDFRDNVLQPFRIDGTATLKANLFPTTFLARLQAAKKSMSKHGAQREAWRLDVSAGRGLTSSTVFPPNLVPPQYDPSQTVRCMLPRMSREGLPLRRPGIKGTLYELPTTNPIYCFGFRMEAFSRVEQAHLNGPLHVSGVSVDFCNGEVLPNRSLFCPYLTFERTIINSQQHIEKARNLCAVTGAQCLRGQQQLFHKAYGSKTVSQPPISFTCALNDEVAVLNFHSLGEDGSYDMAELSRFDLKNDEHFDTLQAWLEAIDSWAVMHLLPRVRAAAAEVAQCCPSPPASPSSPSGSLLSIDTKSNNVVSIVGELRRLCPSVPWQNDIADETPIKSSIAQCGTPLPTRNMRGLYLPRHSNSACSTPSDSVAGPRNTLLSPVTSEVFSPTRFNPLSPRGRPGPGKLSISTDSGFWSQSDGSVTPDSPCRPPSLSPCSPGPEMPMSSMNPMLVLRRRLDVACTEIQELRTQVDTLESQLTNRTAEFERKLQLLSARQDEAEKIASAGLSIRTWNDKTVSHQGDPTEQELRTPTALDSFPPEIHDSQHDDDQVSFIHTMPGSYSLIDDEQDLVWTVPKLDQDLTVWCLAKLMKDTWTQFCVLTLLCFTMLCTGLLDPRAMGAQGFTMAGSDLATVTVLLKWYCTAEHLCKAASELSLESEEGHLKSLNGNVAQADKIVAEQ